jgi:cytochrome d ubiquinol oxidase subunit II
VNATAFVVLGTMLAMYVLLDGYDLGVATLGYVIGRNERERGAAMESVGPFLNGNEVWLIAAGGTLFALFPQAYASSFSGFYLPFMVVLWLLMFRGIALELRHHLPGDLWRGFWDAAFFASSALLIVLFGVAIGNLLRGVPLDADGYFQGTFAFLLNPYALGVGLFALIALAMHGGTFLMFRIAGPLAERARSAVLRLFWPVVAFYALMTIATLSVRSPLHPGLSWLMLVPLISIAGLMCVFAFARRGDGPRTFAASSVFVVSLMAAAGATMYPYVLPGFPAGSGGLTVDGAGASPVALYSALGVTIAGVIAVLVYGTVVFRRFMTPLQVE